MGLGSNANVHATCLRILRSQGFSLRVEGELDADGMFPIHKLWYAEKNGISLYADNPIELLGLAGIYEYHQPTEDIPYWWFVEGDDIQDELYETAWGPFDD